MSDEMKFSRRGFLMGAGVLAVGTAAASMMGCQSESTSSGSGVASTPPAVDEYKAPGVRATATLEGAQPIPPEEPPANWDGEADIVVVGTGGGGLAAALLARDKGASVIVVEKQGEPGGSTQHANIFVNLAGTGTEQKAFEFAVPKFPYDRGNFIRWAQPNFQFSIDDDLFGNVAEAAGECIDWMQGHGANLACIGAGYIPQIVAKGEIHKIMSFKEITDKFHKFGEEAGVEFHFDTPCSAFVVEGDRVVGIKATGPDGEVYYKANKGVILCSGGIGMNPDMLKKYIPTAYEIAVMGGPMPYHTGECTRMALGVGADMSGIDSWCAWESEQDNETGDWKYFWGARQLTQLPWLNIDIRGKRCNFYEWDEFSSGDSVFYQQKEIPFYSPGEDRARTQVQASRIGHRAYAIFDGKFEDYMWSIANPPLGERRPTTADDPIREQSLFNTDWRVEFQNALDDGRIKKADTLEDLADQLGMDPQVLTDSVKTWNDNCAEGEDSGTTYPYSKRFLNPVVEAPFYGSKIGPRIGKTMCGLRVDEDLRVVNNQGKPIPGLYANFTTAGGICGESTYGTSLVNSSILGGNGLSWTTGYLAARTACSD
ncbi:MAG: FAD-binding protein [Actinobacteria bacterium]|nr:FAD-binding protein [Actinomycetota bacterium]